MQVGSSVKGRIGALCDEEVMFPINTRLEVITWLARFERRSRESRIVSNQHERPIRGTPVSDQSQNVCLAFRIIPRTKHGVVETVLDVDDNKRIGHAFTVSRVVEETFGKVSLTSFHREIPG